MITPVELWCWICPACCEPNIMETIGSSIESSTFERCSNQNCYDPGVEYEIAFPDLGG